MTDLITAAEESWGAPLPDWIKSLALACERSSQSKVAAQLDRSPAVVSTVLRKVYKGSYERVEERVRGVLMDGRVECPGIRYVLVEGKLLSCVQVKSVPLRGRSNRRRTRREEQDE